MTIEQGIKKAKQLSGLKGTNKEFYDNVILWLAELKEYKEHKEDKQFHGLSDSRLYHIWVGMKSRCYTASSSNYRYYGGRGIKVCDEWLGSDGFINFYYWAINNGYRESLTIDRINVDGDYSPNNCRWATIFEQAENKRDKSLGGRSVVTLTYNNKTMTIRGWAKHLGIKDQTIRQRLKKGWSVEKTLETPVMTEYSNRGQGRKYNRKMI